MSSYQSLKENKEIVILPADKGNATVVLNRDQYTSKMKELLDQDDYRITKRYPTNKLVSTIKKALVNILQSNNITPELAKRLIPKNPTLPQIYSLPKIHKKEVY